MINRIVLLAILVFASPVVGQDKSPEFKEFQGHWQVESLVENGHVIPKEAIKDWLPSGGRVEIIENAIIFKSRLDGKKHAKVFTIDATTYPNGIEINSPDEKASTGIYRFDDGRLVICIVHPDEAKKPGDFSAKAGSKRMLMVLKRTTPQAQEPLTTIKSRTISEKPKQEGQAARILTDAEVSKRLVGNWRMKDSVGHLYIKFNANGTFSTVREYQKLRLFHKSFVQTPSSSGTWTVKHGTMTAHILSSIRIERVNQLLSFSIRSISNRDMIFVDHWGRIESATKLD
ncbi:MAG: TIGR03067 domain-containing protein [Planctomycetes bacterium]|nr:TIGR03067 domain-containing protein [Planctomycetota bacterium]MCH9725111.1 TIGR03067 domain-containing protein [Planctomycetota bacterium]MCH9774927.1 TIGR03067 domain-containing protein [Planctomycetota bacterium]MCH9789330.1 TIGR03067 domain-containing protein [Planctomycetota bacterium]